MRDLTLILPYYDNPRMFEVQQQHWATLPAELRKHLRVIVVDDGSPRWPARPVVRESGVARFALYRTLVDVRWNWIFCRNLAMSEASTEWALMTDMDHLLPEATLRRLLEGDLSPRVAYRFSRVDAPDLTPYKPHPNTWCLTRALFDQVGGYDETFSGYYGTDGDFRRRLEAIAKIVLLPEVMIRYPREVIADASTTTYTRKEKWDKKNVNRIVAERTKVPNWRPKRLSFPWERQI